MKSLFIPQKLVDHATIAASKERKIILKKKIISYLFKICQAIFIDTSFADGSSGISYISELSMIFIMPKKKFQVLNS